MLCPDSYKGGGMSGGDRDPRGKRDPREKSDPRGKRDPRESD
jgi:hypothetical protein